MSYGISAIYRYPVKGFTPEQISEASLTSGSAMPGDRQFALALAETPFNPAAPDWQPKTKFLMLQRDERLAELHLAYDSVAQRIKIIRNNVEVNSTEVTKQTDRSKFERYLAEFMELSNPPRLVSAPEHSFSDHRNQVISFINLRSVEALATQMGESIDPLRFRANVYFEGRDAWEEFDWLGKSITWGGAELLVTSRIVRCAATNVDPVTAQRDLNIPKALQQGFGHIDMGIYAQVTAGGPVTLDDVITAGI